MPHPSRNTFQALGVELPWDDLQIGDDGFFLPVAPGEHDNALNQAAFRRGIRIKIIPANEVQGAGIRVRRTV